MRNLESDSSIPAPEISAERMPTALAHRPWVFATISFALMMMAIDATIVATALHTLQHDLHASINWAGWTITAYSFGFLLMLPVTGKLSEQYGRRRVFLASVTAFTVASLLCGLAGNIYQLIALRAVQAAGGAGFTPSATGIVVDYFGKERDRAVSLFGSIFPIGAVIGPIFGGFFVTYWSWRGIFFVNVPIGIAVIALSLRFIPKDRPEILRARTRRDVIGMALLGVGLVGGMLAVSYLGERHAQLQLAAFFVPGAIAVLALWGFLRHIRRTADPFIAPHMIYGRGFGAVNAINALYGGVRSGAIVLVPLYATARYGIDALRSGTLLVAQGVATFAFSIIAALLIRRTGYRLPIYVCGVAVAIGIVLFALPPPAGIAPYTWLAATAFLVGAGGGGLNPASRNAGLQLEPEHASTLAALRTMALQMGTITTISLATAWLTGRADPGTAQAWVFVAVAAALVAGLPLVARIPDHRGAW
ncbi:MAG: MFS transporter [Rhodanobacter sp.]|nr:MAG: MFS transporter [Rhodanobacter sp.]TAM10289.1 MAG: MFS transporter [Rhodanobacter sp.]TAM37655.1 MAG: MFS transporter [Rhodanobacter sp.]